MSVALAGAAALTLATSGCTPEAAGSSWAGTVDTLASGQVVVRNPDVELWDDHSRWRMVEELRIGTIDGTGPDMFGSISDFEIDALGRLYALEGQAQELRVFGRDGSHVRTVGRQGEGPGEFNRVIGITWGPDGNLWAVDPSNNRLSVVDTAGTFLTSHPTIGGVMIMPWPGGFDDVGHFYTYGITEDPDAEFGITLVMVRYDQELLPIDSVAPPEFPGDEEYFELRTDDGFMATGVPFTPELQWRLENGRYWAALTGDYRIFELSWAGDTLRTITREFESQPVTGEDMNRALEDLEWFIENGGKIDRSRIPNEKPPIEEFFLDDDGNLWVLRSAATEADEGRVFDVFDSLGRYLGQLRTPFPVAMYPPPIVRGGYLYALTEDELEVPFLVRARIEKPSDLATGS
jgi:hypothetical protein